MSNSGTTPAVAKNVGQLPGLNQDVLTLLFEIRMELRVLNTLIAETLNAQSDPDQLRQDPYYNGATDQAGTDSLVATATR